MATERPRRVLAIDLSAHLWAPLPQLSSISIAICNCTQMLIFDRSALLLTRWRSAGGGDCGLKARGGGDVRTVFAVFSFGADDRVLAGDNK